MGNTTEENMVADLETSLIVAIEALFLIVKENHNVKTSTRVEVLEALDISDEFALACLEKLGKHFNPEGRSWK